MNIFVKALEGKGQTCVYLRTKFPKLSEVKLKEGILIGLEIREVIEDKDRVKDILSTLNDTENAVWNAFKSVCTNFLGNHKTDNCRQIGRKLISVSNV
jgi:hypothetical protein